MRLLFSLVLAFGASVAHAQIGPLSTDLITIGVPLTIQTGDVTSLDGNDAITAGEGASSIIPGFVLVDVDPYERFARYNVIDVTGGAAVAVCFLLPCSGIPEQRNGTDTGDGWVFVDGVFLPRFETGILRGVGFGSLGAGATFGASGAGSSGDGGSLGWVDVGPQLAYGMEVGALSVLATSSYVWGYEGGSQKMSGRGTRFKTYALYPLGLSGYHLIGTFAVDHRANDGGTDDPVDDFEGSFVTFGVGLGF